MRRGRRCASSPPACPRRPSRPGASRPRRPRAAARRPRHAARGLRRPVPAPPSPRPPPPQRRSGRQRRQGYATSPPCPFCPPVPLRRNLPEVFRIEFLKVGLQRIGVERLTGRAPSWPSRPRLTALPRLDGGEPEQVLAREDGGLEAQRHGDGV